MSEENVEVVRAVLDAQRRQDWGAFPQLYDPEIEWDDVSGLWGDWGTRRGFDDVRNAFLAWWEAFEQVDFDLEGSILESGDDVLANLRISGRGRGSGLPVNQLITLIWTVRGGRVTRVRAYRERAEALEAAGLSEQAMSEENVEIVRGHIEAWRAEDAPRAVSFFDPYVVADVSRTGGIDSAFYGREAITEFFRRFAGTFEDYRWEVERLIDLGSGAVLAVLRETGRGKGSGVPVDRPLATLYTVIDGKIARITTFRTEQDALKAAGLRE